MMRKKKIITKKLNKQQEKTLHDHLDHHVCKYYHKHFHVAHHTNHGFRHLGELMLVLLVWCMSWIFAWTVWLPSNDYFVYPLEKVSTIDCRTEYRNDMDPACKINLPRIGNADYERYINSTLHRQLYTVLRAAPYKAWRDQTAWAHAGLDIATARGTPLRSIGNGQVTYAWRQNGYGNVVKIKYLFQWKYIHAVYAHMDIIEVEAGQKISVGTRIGTVGNSWTTFGALGGFHLHFEITRNNSWRPMYGYLWCPDLSKWHMTIIQEWLCREQLLANHYDPIVLFEQNRLGHVIPQQTIADRWDEEVVDDEEDINTNEWDQWSEQTIENVEAIQDTPTTIPSNNDEMNQDIPKQDDNEDSKEHAVAEEERIIEEEKIIPSEEIQPPQQPQKQSTDNKDTQEDWRLGEKISIDVSEFDDEIQHFFSTHDLYINNYTGDNTIQVGSKKEIEINFYKKWTDSKFIGVLPFTLELIPSQKYIQTNITNINLISPNPTTIQVYWVRTGRSVLIISIDHQTIEKIVYKIQ